MKKNYKYNEVTFVKTIDNEKFEARILHGRVDKNGSPIYELYWDIDIKNGLGPPKFSETDIEKDISKGYIRIELNGIKRLIKRYEISQQKNS